MDGSSIEGKSLGMACSKVSWCSVHALVHAYFTDMPTTIDGRDRPKSYDHRIAYIRIVHIRQAEGAS